MPKLETTKKDRDWLRLNWSPNEIGFQAWLAGSNRAQRLVPCALRDVGTVLAALPEIDLLTRVAEALAYRGIEPASDIEKLRVAAANIRELLGEGRTEEGEG